MADQAGSERKSQLIFEMERSRSELARSIQGVKGDLSVTAHLKRTVLRRKLVSITTAAVVGLVLTRLLFRKKKAVKEVAAAAQFGGRFRENERAGVWLSVLGLLIPLLKPVVTTLLSRNLADYAKDGHPPSLRPLARR